MSNNVEDRLFAPEDTLDFFQSYAGPKKLLLNQGIHASAEIGGLLDIPGNYVWRHVRAWLDHWLKGVGETDQNTVHIEVRGKHGKRENFQEWPSARIAAVKYTMSPRGRWGLHGWLDAPKRASEEGADTITFGRGTGLHMGVPIIGEALQVFVDHRIVSHLWLASRSHAIWYKTPVARRTTICGTPKLNLDVTFNSPRWQLVAYLFSVDWKDDGTLISHGALSCWNCTANQRIIESIELRTLCEDVSGGIALGLSLFSELYQPASTDGKLSATFHCSDDVSLSLPILLAGEDELSRPSRTLII